MTSSETGSEPVGHAMALSGVQNTTTDGVGKSTTTKKKLQRSGSRASSEFSEEMQTAFRGGHENEEKTTKVSRKYSETPV